jgi:hypothetical protein
MYDVPARRVSLKSLMILEPQKHLMMLTNREPKHIGDTGDEVGSLPDPIMLKGLTTIGRSG